MGYFKAAMFIKDHWKGVLMAALGMFLLPLAFATSFISLKSIPMVNDKIIQTYMKGTSNAAKGKNINIDWRYLVAIDAVRLHQDFSKVSLRSVESLSEKFIKEEKIDIKYNFNNYTEATNRINREKDVNLDWRNVVIVDSVLSKSMLDSDISKAYDIAAKFIKVTTTTEEYTEWVEKEVEVTYTDTYEVYEWVEHTYSYEVEEWVPWLSFAPWLGGRYVTITKESTYLSYELVTKEVEKTKIVKKKVPETKTKTIENISLKSVDSVLAEYGYNSNAIPDKFRNINTINNDLVKETQIVYKVKDLDTVLNEMKFSSQDITDIKRYMQVGLAMGSPVGGGGGGSGGKLEAQAFIDKVSAASMDTYTKYGVYPSISIAQSILESGWGGSGLTQKANNLFGIKAFDWSGNFVEMPTTEYYGGIKQTVMAKFRAYPTWNDSIEDHGKFLADNKRYKKNGVFSSSNFVDQAYSLQKAGYATDPSYAMKLINLIYDYNLNKFDEQVMLAQGN